MHCQIYNEASKVYTRGLYIGEVKEHSLRTYFSLWLIVNDTFQSGYVLLQQYRWSELMRKAVAYKSLRQRALWTCNCLQISMKRKYFFHTTNISRKICGSVILYYSSLGLPLFKLSVSRRIGETWFTYKQHQCCLSYQQFQKLESWHCLLEWSIITNVVWVDQISYIAYHADKPQRYNLSKRVTIAA